MLHGKASNCCEKLMSWVCLHCIFVINLCSLCLHCVLLLFCGEQRLCPHLFQKKKYYKLISKAKLGLSSKGSSSRKILKCQLTEMRESALNNISSRYRTKHSGTNTHNVCKQPQLLLLLYIPCVMLAVEQTGTMTQLKAEVFEDGK